MSSDSSTAQLNAAIARVKTYTSPTLATTVGRLTSNRVYPWQAPAAAPFPHVVIRKQNGVTNRELGNAQEMFDLEATCVAHPRENEVRAEELADIVQQALLTWRESSSTIGLTLALNLKSRDREESDIDTATNQEVVVVRLVVECVSWPRLLTAAVT